MIYDQVRKTIWEGLRICPFLHEPFAPKHGNCAYGAGNQNVLITGVIQTKIKPKLLIYSIDSQ